jgi:nucleotide-binding universal stress UspA family protein
MNRILIAVDGSPSSLDAVRYGIGLLRNGLRATLVLAQVQDEASFLELATQDADAIANAALEAGEHLMASAVELLQAAGVPYEKEVGLGDPASTLVDMSERLECNSLVVGARGMNALQRTWLGSVSQSVLNHSRVPVTIVKQHVDEAMDVLGESGDSDKGDVAE